MPEPTPDPQPPVTIAVHVGTNPDPVPAADPASVTITPTAGLDWLHRVTVAVDGTRLVVAVSLTDPAAPRTVLTMRPNGALHLSNA
jgi:hypothetical protein